MKNKIIFTSLLFPLIVFAHTHVKESIPAKDSVIRDAPKEVHIEFSEKLESAMSNIEVKNAKTNEVVSEKSVNPNESKTWLEVKIKPLKKEKTLFHVLWKAVSKDGHTMKGSYDFTFDPATK